MTGKQVSEEELYRLPSGKVITGTMIWYSAICEREVWLMAHNLTPDEEHFTLDFGRATHELFYSNMKKEIEAEGMKIDIVKGKDKLICEVKTSSKFLDATKLQLTYYLWRLEKMGVIVNGEILIPREKKRIKISLNEKLRSKLELAISRIVDICSKPLPPAAVRIPFCKKCAYFDFCWG